MDEQWTDEMLKAYGVGDNFVPRMKACKTAVLSAQECETTSEGECEAAEAEAKRATEVANLMRFAAAVALHDLHEDYPVGRATGDAGWLKFCLIQLGMSKPRVGEHVRVGKWVKDTQPDLYDKLLEVLSVRAGYTCVPYANQPLIESGSGYEPLCSFSWKAAKDAEKAARDREAKAKELKAAAEAEKAAAKKAGKAPPKDDLLAGAGGGTAPATPEKAPKTGDAKGSGRKKAQKGSQGPSQPLPAIVGWEFEVHGYPTDGFPDLLVEQCGDQIREILDDYVQQGRIELEGREPIHRAIDFRIAFTPQFAPED